MKSLLISIMCFLWSLSFSQGELFELSEDKTQFPSYVVVESEDLSIEQGYQSVLEWINITYDSPDKVIKSQIENKYIRINGIAKNLYAYDAMGAMITNIQYDIEFKFQQNRVKFDITELQFYIPAGQYNAAGWAPLSFDYNKAFKKNGKRKKVYWKQVDNVLSYFNNLSSSLNKHLKNPTENFKEEEKW
jgi:hypothetical protein